MTSLLSFGLVADFINGRAFKPEEWDDEGRPIIRIQNLTGTSNVFNYFRGDLEERYRVRDGDLLISWSASLGVYIWRGNEAALNQHIFKVKLRDSIDKRYFYYAAQNALTEMIGRVHGTTMQHITKDRFDTIEIPVPAMDEQKRIAALLDKADRLRRLRRYAREIGEGFLQAVFLEMFGDPATNPCGWESVELGALLENIDSGWSPNCEETRASHDQWAILRLSAVTYGVYRPEENKRLPSHETPRPELEVRPGDVLFTRKNTHDLVGACAFVHATPPKLMLPDTIFRFKIAPRSTLTGEYLFGLLNSKSYKRKVQLLASGTAGSMPNISKEKLLELQVPLPPDSAQARFKAIVRRYEYIYRQQAEAERQAEHLFQTLLHCTFSKGH